MQLQGKKILLGITGGIASYKIPELVRLFKKSGAEVRVIMTPSAVNFVSPITLSALSGNEVSINIFPENISKESGKIDVNTKHVYEGLWADVFLIAPATANTIAKVRYGIADNFLTATVLASRCPIVISPSMDEDMFVNEVTASNISKLKEFGYHIIEPESGELASGLKGIGRMPEPESLFSYTEKFLENYNKDLSGKKILITAGPTYEPIDRVRFVGNYSSGKMGFQIARAAVQRGAEVTIITGPTLLETPRNVNRINVQTAEEMFDAVMKNINGKSTVIMSAAVSDYKPKHIAGNKIKKYEADINLELTRTVDILEHLGQNKSGFNLIGFALETDDEINYAKEKLVKKNLDMIVVNNPNIDGAGFGTDTNVITIIDKDMKQVYYEKMSKFEIANKILDKIIEL